MLKFGPTSFNTRIATIADLDKLIVYAAILPALSEVAVNTTVYLTGSQPGYLSGHLYRCREDEQGTRSWEDVTNESGYPLKPGIDGDSSLEVNYLGKTEGEDFFADGYLEVAWVAPSYPPEFLDNKHVVMNPLNYEVVVRKIGDYPDNPYDGEILVAIPFGSTDIAGQTKKSYEIFDDKGIGDLRDLYKYRVFHVYQSGWWSKNDCEHAGEKERQ